MAEPLAAAAAAKPGDFDFQKFLKRVKENPDDSGFHGRAFSDVGSYYDQGFFITPIRGKETLVGSGQQTERVEGPINSYRVTKDLGDGKSNNVFGGGASAQYQGVDYAEYDPEGKVLKEGKWNTLKKDKFITEGAKFIASMMTMGVGAAVGAGAGAAASGAGGAGAGAGAGGTAIHAGSLASIPGGTAGMFSAEALAGYSATGAALTQGASTTIPGAVGGFNPGVDSQAANTAIGPDAIEGYRQAATAGTATAAGTGKGIVDTLTKAASTPLGKMALQSALTAAVSAVTAKSSNDMVTPITGSLTDPPDLPKPETMPDPAPTGKAQSAARRRSIVEQLARNGRASTILTRPSGGGRLGG